MVNVGYVPMAAPGFQEYSTFFEGPWFYRTGGMWVQICISGLISESPSGDSGLFFVLMPYRFSGVSSVKRQWDFPELQDTFIFFFLPGLLKNKKSRGWCSFVMRDSPTGVRSFSLAIICAGCSPVGGFSPLSSLLDETSTTLDL